MEGYYNKLLMLEEKENFAMEILKWKKQRQSKSAIVAFSQCSPQTFPILHKIFMIFLYLVSSPFCSPSTKVVDTLFYD